MTFWYVAFKDLKIQIKDISGLIFLFLTPVVVITVASFALSGLWNTNASTFQIPLVQLDHGSQANQFVSKLKKVSALALITTYTDQNNKQQPMTLAKAREQISSLKAAIVIPENFSQSVQNKRSVDVQVIVDPVDRVVPSVVSSVLNQVATQFTGQSSLINVTQSKTVSDPNYHQPTPFESNVPGYAVMFMLFSTSFAGASLLAEKEAGTLRKLKTMPISRFSVLGGKMLSNFLVAILQGLILFAVGHFVFGMWLGKDAPALFLLIIMTAFAATGLGMLVAAFVKTRSQATGITILLVLGMSALGGSWWPLYIVPSWMQQLAHITLTAWAMDGFNQLLIYGKTLSAIVLSLVVLAGIGIVCFSISVARFRFN